MRESTAPEHEEAEKANIMPQFVTSSVPTFLAATTSKPQYSLQSRQIKSESNSGSDDNNSTLFHDTAILIGAIPNIKTILIVQ